MGSLESIMRLIPGLSAAGPMNVDEKQIKRIEAIIQSMTPLEPQKCKNPQLQQEKAYCKGKRFICQRNQQTLHSA
ncbi:MAG: hypothetical protein LRY51_17410 [Geovibrio sp.]|nr:hypothetical protein [Geovibrio sp.]